MSLILISLSLFSSFVLYVFGKYVGIKGSKIISILTIIINGLIGIKLLINYNIKGEIIKVVIKEWINVSTINISLELILSKEGLIMINLINFIKGIVIIYSFYYMKEEYNLNKFISYLFLFSVSMGLLVLSNNFLSLFVGWEFVGLMSFLLINFWNTSLNSNKSGLKAILFNKIGDISLILALIFLYYHNSFNINLPFIENYNSLKNVINFQDIYFLFLIASFAKSAQFIFHCWLSDAMAGPTPVSALLHAATMVTAGVYLLLKLNINNYMLNIINKEIIIIIGILTIIFASLNSIYNKDIKKIIAFSTASQIGLMIINIGFGQYTEEFNSIFHLFTHGFFKALLFLTAGILIHNLVNEQDIRKYGSLVLKFPFSYSLFLIGTLTIIATPYLSGYYSKELIIFNSYFFNNHSIFYILLCSSVLTSLYSINLFFKTFVEIPSFSSLLFLSFSKTNTHPEMEVNKTSHYYYYVLFFLLIFLSLTIGFFTINNFNSPYTVSLINHIDYSIIPSFYKSLPFYIISLFICVFVLYSGNLNIFSRSLSSYIFYSIFPLKLYYISNFFSKKGFFDFLINYLFVLPILNFSYNISFKIIEKGYLEFFGPVSLFRLFYYFPLHYNLEKHNSSLASLTYFFIFLSISFFLLIPFQYLILI